MKTLVLGATGATGRLLVDQLASKGHQVRVIVRPTSNYPEKWNDNGQIEIIKGLIHKIGVDEMAEYIKDCQALASCLGHNLSFKGIYGKPRKLVRNAVRLLCSAIEQNQQLGPVKIVLMNTAGNRNRDLKENISIGQRMIIGLLRLLLPPHPDNEKAADHLRVKVGQKHGQIEWVAVRPDSLINKEEVSEYTIHQSPTRSALFNPGKTSRINVANFMARLIDESELWSEWKGQMPVIYNVES